jgi:hypothetical protein
MKKLLLISALICFAATLLLSLIEANLLGWKGIWIFEFFPGINGLASQGNYPSTTKIGMNIALLCVLFMLPLSITKGDLQAFHKSVAGLSKSQKSLYGLATLGLLAAILFISPPPSGSHQISNNFFSLVASNALFLAIFTVSFYIFALSSILFSLILIFKRA